MGQVAGVLDDPPGFPCTPPGVDVLEGGKLTSNNVADSSHASLQSFAVASGAVSKPGGGAAGQDALHSPMFLGHLLFLCCIPEKRLSPILEQTKNEQTVVDFMLKDS